MRLFPRVSPYLWRSIALLTLALAPPALAGSGDTLVFIDMNLNLKEFLAARDSAARLGLHFVSIPEESLLLPLDRIAALDAECNDRLEDLTDGSAEYRRLEKLCADYDEQLDRLVKPGTFDPGQSLAKLADRLASEKHSIATFVLSGHHSGGYFGGNFLTSSNLSDGQLKRIITGNPAVFANLETIALWGCAGVTVPDAAEWRIRVPSLKVLGGFYDSAPLGIRPESAHYLTDLLAKAESLPKIASPLSLRRQIEGISGVRDTYAGVYVHTDSGEDWIYYKGSDDPSPHFESLTSEIRCQEFRSRLTNETQIVRNYFEGQLPLPVDGNDSPLRKAYFDFAQNKDCYIPSAKNYAPSQAGLLRFYETGLKQNFALVFRATLDAASDEWNQVDFTVLRDAFRQSWEKDHRLWIELAEDKLRAPMESLRERLKIDAKNRAEQTPGWHQYDAAISREFAALPRRLRRRMEDESRANDYPAILEIAGTLRPHLLRRGEHYFEAVRTAASLREKITGNVQAQIEADKKRLESYEAEFRKYEDVRVNGYRSLDTYLAELKTARDTLGKIRFADALLRSDRAAMIRLYAALRKSFDVSARPDVKDAVLGLFPNMLKTIRAIDRVLYRMDPECVDLLPWHESTRNIPPLKCSLD